LFSQLYDFRLNAGTSFLFIEKQLIADFQKIVKAVIKKQIENKMNRFIFKSS